MAKVGSLQQGYVGKLNGQCYFKGADGKTIVRNIVSPKNPKTLSQRVQRVITKTVGDNYKVMKAICDHSFEGCTLGFQCANKFRSLNASHMRDRAAYLQEMGQSLYSYYQFSKIGNTKFTPAAVYVSEGTLNQVYASIAANLGQVAVADNTYQAVIEALGARRGDQMTFVTVEKDANDNCKFHFSRIILDPRNENGAAELTEAFLAEGQINCPNSRNAGSFTTLSIADGHLKFALAGGPVVAAGIIMSRRNGDKWFRSTCQLALSEDGLGNYKMSLMDAAEGSNQATPIDVESELYLNNAGNGGGQGTSDVQPGGEVVPDVPGAALGNIALINGAQQSIAGGSINVTGSLGSVALTGSNLNQATFSYTKNGAAGSVTPTVAENGGQALWSNLQGVANDVFVFSMNGSPVLAVNVQANGGGGSDPN